jgi:flagellar biosynthetic protein FliP
MESAHGAVPHAREATLVNHALMNHALMAAGSNVNVNISGLKDPSTSVLIIVALTVLSVAPAVLMLVTAFPRVFIVLSLTRNALGTQTVPPNQVLAGLALILSLFIMAPVISTIYSVAVRPYEHGALTATQAIQKGEVPLKKWMLEQTRDEDISLFTSFAHQSAKHPETLPMTTVIPAFVLSEFESAFLIGFMIFIPFMIIDLVVSSIMMSMGMYMLPPTLISLPFKILLFVLVNGWALMTQSLLSSFNH